LNDITVFSESIEDGIVTNRNVILRDPSALHETLQKMIEDGGAPREIAIVQEFIELIDLNLKFALQNGIIDDCSYSFIFRKQLNGMKSTCTDIIGNEQDFIEISKYDPFDHVNQVELTRVDPLTELTISISSLAPSNPISQLFEPISVEKLNASTVPSSEIPVDAFNPPMIMTNEPSNPIKSPLQLWLLGILTPTYLWSAAGFMRLI